MKDTKLKVFEFYLDLNNFQNPDKYMEVAKFIVSNDFQRLYNMSYNGQIFEYFIDYLEWEISKKDFVAIGAWYDTNNQKVHNNNGGIHTWFELLDTYINNQKDLKNALILLDEDSLDYLKSKNESKYNEMYKYIMNNSWNLFVL